MKEGWLPADAGLGLTPAAIESLLRPVFPGPLRSAVRTQGGLGNLNYRVELEGRADPVLLRIYLRNPEAAPLEAAVARRLQGLVPVPVFLGQAAANPVTGHPYAVTSWLEGVPLAIALRAARRDPAACRALGQAAGTTLAALGSVTFPEPGLLNAALEVAHPLAPGRAGYLEIIHLLENDLVFERLGAALARSYRNLVDQGSHLMEALLDRPSCLVHSDYDPANLLVRHLGGRWQVSGVLDWEFAHSGSPLADLGHLLRPPAGALPGFEQGLLDGYTGAGGSLPAAWRPIARLLDLVAFVEFLSRPGAGPEVVRSARGAIQDLVRSWER